MDNRWGSFCSRRAMCRLESIIFLCSSAFIFHGLDDEETEEDVMGLLKESLNPFPGSLPFPFGGRCCCCCIMNLSIPRARSLSCCW